MGLVVCPWIWWWGHGFGGVAMDLVVCAMDLVVWWLWRGHAIGGVAMDLGGVAMNVPVGHVFGGVAMDLARGA